MTINALNSGAKVFMADFEDALSPTWANVVGGQAALQDAVRRTLAFHVARRARTTSWAISWRRSSSGRAAGTSSSATSRSTASRCPARCSTSGCTCCTTAPSCCARGSGPYFYLPKMQCHREARLWNDVFVWAQDVVGVPRGSIRATVLIETIWAAFEMDEILYELREHAAGLNAGRWDYIFSIIKAFARAPRRRCCPTAPRSRWPCRSCAPTPSCW